MPEEWGLLQEVYQMYPNALSQKILYEFQKKALNQATPNYFYALDTGTGKTITSIHHYMKFCRGEPLLIVAPPQKLKEGGWDRDIEFVSDKYGVSINYETLSYGKIAKDWSRYADHFVIFDEAHYVKNPTSQRGKAAMHLTKKSTHFVLLTATPMSNGWEDAYNYMIMFGHYRNKTDMKKQHAIYGLKNFGAKSIPVIEGWVDTDALQSKFNSYTVSISKADALDLPPLVIRDIKMNASAEYKTIKKTRVLDDIAFDSPSKMAHGLRHYANRKDKLDYFIMLLEGTSNNVVVFYQYTSEINAMKEALKKMNKTIFEVSGKASKLPPKSEWGALRDSVTLVQYQAGSAGIELQYANVVLFYTPTYSFQDYSQAMGRTYRNGQTKKVTVYRFITSKTIEEAVYAALERKEDFNEKLYLETRLGG